MVAAPLSYSSGHGSGPRPVNLRSDIPQILNLLNKVFSAAESDGGHPLNRTSLTQHPWFVTRLRQLSHGVVPGYVWEESGSIVGNVSLLSTNVRGRYLVANVAVDPDFRRQGIARALMETALSAATKSGGRELLLQVRQENEAAIRLYQSLGFHTVGSTTSWYASFSQFRLLPVTVSTASPDRSGDFFIRPLRRDEWRDAFQLDALVVHPDLNWPEPLRESDYKVSVWRSLNNLINGRRSETWVAELGNQQLAGLAILNSEWGRLHTLTLRVLPEWRDSAAQLLLAKLLRRLQHSYRRNVRIDHPADDETTNNLLQRANFVPRRTLTTMSIDVRTS